MNDDAKEAEAQRLKQEGAQILAEIEKLEGKPASTLDDPVSPGAAWLLLLPIDLLRAVIMADLWLWFAAPLGAPAVGVFHMAGALMVWHVLRRPRQSSTEGKVTRFHLAQHVLESLMAWGLGALYHWAM